jgi:hypothetical protein
MLVAGSQPPRFRRRAVNYVILRPRSGRRISPKNRGNVLFITRPCSLAKGSAVDFRFRVVTPDWIA